MKVIIIMPTKYAKLGFWLGPLESTETITLSDQEIRNLWIANENQVFAYGADVEQIIISMDELEALSAEHCGQSNDQTTENFFKKLSEGKKL